MSLPQHPVSVLTLHRDSEDSAPAEYPPDQPEADLDVDDGVKYGEEEVELEEALKKEEAELAAQEHDAMEGTHEDEEEESDAGSEDLGAESTDDEDEEEEEGEGAEGGEAEHHEEDHDVEMGEDASHK